MTGPEFIAAERRRQVEVEGYSPEHDAAHDAGEMSAAARCYLTAVFGQIAPKCGWTEGQVDDIVLEHGVLTWPWDADGWNPSDDPVRNLVKAGALVAAEIDRLLAEREGGRA